MFWAGPSRIFVANSRIRSLKEVAEMLFPKTKIDYSSTYQGRLSNEGWLILDIGNMELEGVTKIYLDLRDVDEIKAKKNRASDSASDAKRLLGG